MKLISATIFLVALFAASNCQTATTQNFVCRDNCTCTKHAGCSGCEPGYTFTEIVPEPTPAPVTPTRLMAEPEVTPEKNGRCSITPTKSLLWFLLIGLVFAPILLVLIWVVFCPKGFENF